MKKKLILFLLLLVSRSTLAQVPVDVYNTCITASTLIKRKLESVGNTSLDLIRVNESYDFYLMLGQALYGDKISKFNSDSNFNTLSSAGIDELLKIKKKCDSRHDDFLKDQAFVQRMYKIQKPAEEISSATQTTKQQSVGEAKPETDKQAKTEVAALAKVEASKAKAEADALAKAEAAKQAKVVHDAALALELSQTIKAINTKVIHSWVIPATGSEDLKCTIKIKLKPDGTVISAEIISSSGDEVFDRSAENAVQKASPLPVPNDKELFAKEFSSFQFLFIP